MITILNGNSMLEKARFNDYLKALAKQLKTKGEDVQLLELNNLNLKYCTGCWSCWWKTPGLCALKDDMSQIYKLVVKSDILILASPMIKGFETSLLKGAKERLIPLLHPYIDFRNGESHHKKRYEKYPDIVYLTQKEDDTDVEDLKILHDIQKRYAINFHAKLKVFATTNEPTKAIADEIITN